MSVPYINYMNMKEFYTIKEVWELFQMSKDELRRECETHQIEPRRNEIGEYGFVKYDVRKLHNLIYHADKTSPKNESPWD